MTSAIGSAGCLFCEVPEEHILLTSGRWVVRWDQHPATPGHVLLLPRRHVVSYFDLDTDEAAGLHATLLAARALLDDLYAPDGWNLGVNDGLIAGRTVHHVHLHLIPRYRGDTADPRGGIRRGLPGGVPPAARHQPSPGPGPTGPASPLPGVARAAGPAPSPEGLRL